ncbi:MULTISPECIES: hypothetical protein [unclassified Streptomyces]|uniref:hypothetical protein n=1 Tax=unclassified Streptomyces TaxID=2593676 RepID=UPI0031BA3D86
MGDVEPDTEPEFAHLLPRDAEVATFLHHLPNGAAMGYKALAAAHPRYGQQAIRTSLRRLTEAGHLRWVKEHTTVEDNSMRWVTRTYWSKEPKTPEWWAEFVRERHGREVTDAYQSGLARVTEPEPQPTAPLDAEPSAAHRTLAKARARVTRAVMICPFCEEPDTSVELVNGICTECCPLEDWTGYVPDTFLARPRPAGDDGVVDVTARVAELRRAAGLPTGQGGGV